MYKRIKGQAQEQQTENDRHIVTANTSPYMTMAPSGDRHGVTEKESSS